MKKIIAFIIMVIIIILIIVLSYNYYNKKSNNKKLRPDTSSELILHNRNTDKDKDKEKEENSSGSNSESTTNSNTPSTEAEDSGNVPNTASFGDGEFIPIDHVDINIAESIIRIGQRTKIFVTFYPGNASDRNVFYSSNDKSVARVTSTGEVIGVGVGSTIIDVSVQDDIYKILVTVI